MNLVSKIAWSYGSVNPFADIPLDVPPRWACSVFNVRLGGADLYFPWFSFTAEPAAASTWVKYLLLVVSLFRIFQEVSCWLSHLGSLNVTFSQRINTALRAESWRSKGRKPFRGVGISLLVLLGFPVPFQGLPRAYALHQGEASWTPVVITIKGGS